MPQKAVAAGGRRSLSSEVPQPVQPALRCRSLMFRNIGTDKGEKSVMLGRRSVGAEVSASGPGCQPTLPTVKSYEELYRVCGHERTDHTHDSAKNAIILAIPAVILSTLRIYTTQTRSTSICTAV